MKKTTVCKAVVAGALCTMLAGCGNLQVIDTTWNYDDAIILRGNETEDEGHVEAWRDYDDSDMIQVRLSNGKTYYTHGSNVILIDDPSK